MITEDGFLNIQLKVKCIDWEQKEKEKPLLLLLFVDSGDDNNPF